VIVDGGSIEQLGDFRAGLRVFGRPDSLPLTATYESGGQRETDYDASYHLLNLKPAR
jgi:hypothetical protein